MFMKLSSLGLGYGGTVFSSYIVLDGKDDKANYPEVYNNDK